MAAAIVVDLKDPRVPQCLFWSPTQVADWIADIGLSQYRDCFEKNMISGMKLVHVTASHLPDMGVTDFEHIKKITAAIRGVLELEHPCWNRSISLPPRNNLGMYIERKSVRGQYSSSITYQQFLDTNPNALWQPPVNNHCQLLPH